MKWLTKNIKNRQYGPRISNIGWSWSYLVRGFENFLRSCSGPRFQFLPALVGLGPSFEKLIWSWSELVWDFFNFLAPGNRFRNLFQSQIVFGPWIPMRRYGIVLPTFPFRVFTVHFWILHVTSKDSVSTQPWHKWENLNTVQWITKSISGVRYDLPPSTGSCLFDRLSDSWHPEVTVPLICNKKAL